MTAPRGAHRAVRHPPRDAPGKCGLVAVGILAVLLLSAGLVVTGLVFAGRWIGHMIVSAPAAPAPRNVHVIPYPPTKGTPIMGHPLPDASPLMQRIAFNLSFHAVPVVPGPVKHFIDYQPRRLPRPGEPGHLERLLAAAPVGAWPLADRWRAMKDEGRL